MMKSGARVALAVGVGYLLGRRRKLQVALALGSAVAAGRLSAGSGDLLRRGTKGLLSSADLGKVAGLGGPLVAAGKAAAMTAVSSRIDSVSDRLQDRAETLRGRGGEDSVEQPRGRAHDDDADEDEFEEEPYDEYEEDGPPEEEAEDEEPEPPRGAARSGAATASPVRRRGR